MSTTQLIVVILLGSASFLTVGSASQLNCTTDKRICRAACNEKTLLQYSSTYCDAQTGNCICDCRDTLSSKCTFTPFTPCYQFCVDRNPNPEFFLYVGGICPIILNHRNRTLTMTEQCACKCSVRQNDVVSSVS